MLAAQAPREPAKPGLYLGMGAKVGEVSHDRAIVHVKLTRTPGHTSKRRVPGAEGEARLHFGVAPELDGTRPDPARHRGRSTKWLRAVEDRDFSVQFVLEGLPAASRITYVVEYRPLANAKAPALTPQRGGSRAHGSGNATPSNAKGKRDERASRQSAPFSFHTPAKPDTRRHVCFQVTTGQDVRGMDTYRSMAQQGPHFLVSTGDNVYYDKAIDARSVPEAYTAYEEIYGFEQAKDYFRHVIGYFEKDDHDYRWNDADPYMIGRWVGKKQHKRLKRARIVAERKNAVCDGNWLTHEEGIAVFKTVFPMSEKTYRTFRWGKGLQIWLLEGRDYRSPNRMKDGPDKTIWGRTQRAWLYKTLAESDADWRVVISPTPIVGPDRTRGKRDNHANPKGFWHEGQAFLKWVAAQKRRNIVLACGDRHWQYHSIDKRGTHEFSCGPTCDQHTQNVPPTYDGITRPYGERKGGFLQGEYDPASRALSFKFFNARGKQLYKTSLPPAK